MFRVEEGLVRLERRTIDGRLIVLGVAGPGDLIGEASLFAQAYHCDATATQKSVVSVCERAKLLDAMAADPTKALEFARSLARQLQATRHRLEFRNVRSAQERILLYLDLNAETADRRVPIDGKLQDIAAEIGLTREALYRGLAALERAGKIMRRPGSIRLNS